MNEYKSNKDYSSLILSRNEKHNYKTVREDQLFRDDQSCKTVDEYPRVPAFYFNKDNDNRIPI